MIKTSLIATIDNSELLNKVIPDGVNNSRILISQTYNSLSGSFKSVTRSTAGTTIITKPGLGGSIKLSDLIVTSDRVALASFSIRFTDDTYTIPVISADVNDAPCNLALSFTGNLSGWKNARLELVSVGTVTVTVVCSYYKITENYSLSYSAWNALR